MLDIREITGEITGVHCEDIDIGDSFMDLAARFAPMPGTVILLSGGDLDCARYHILAAKPWLSFSGLGQRMIIKAGDEEIKTEADPFDILGMILNSYRLDAVPSFAPVGAGLFGYLSYDLKDYLEDLPRTTIDDLRLPVICLYAPSIIVIRDKIDCSTRLFIPKRTLSGKNHLDEDLAFFNKILKSEPPFHDYPGGNGRGSRSNFAMSAYMTAIEKIREYIASGHVYQVNMSQRFETDFSGDPFGLFLRLFNNNPAPFFAYIHAGDHHIISTSPERFLKQMVRRIETRPIKGTRPRGKNPSEDQALKMELEQSKKDDAELSMIVDLLRNDLGKVCKAGSVRVTQHKRIEAYQNVYHLVSIIEGTLDNNYDSVDLIKATFPGGSITGCPKIRAMEIIDELETHRRHVYTGSIGYIGFHDSMDLSIAIRTATVYKGKMIFSVGGGIVYDSEPLDEYNETLHKGKTIMEVLKGEKESMGIRQSVWINGSVLPLEEASLSITDLGLQYGYGFFETIRVDRCSPGHLDTHMERFNRTWKHLFNDNIPDLTWREIVNQVILENRLEQEIAAVKIMATFGTRSEPPFDHTIIVTARPYVHRLAGKREPGLVLVTYPHPRYTPLADYKSLNYLYYYMAGKWASEQGHDEALILNPDGSVSETNSANVLLIRGKEIIKPVSPHVLPGVMEGKVCELLLGWGYRVENKPVLVDDLFSADNILITNSLMGALPALALDNRELKSSPDFCRKINDVLL